MTPGETEKVFPGQAEIRVGRGGFRPGGFRPGRPRFPVRRGVPGGRAASAAGGGQKRRQENTEGEKRPRTHRPGGRGFLHIHIAGIIE
jgi:hypothetical protein